jgi:hypothetical protein
MARRIRASIRCSLAIGAPLPHRVCRGWKPMFERGEIPVIIFGIFVAVLFILATGTPPTGLYSEHWNYSDALQRTEDNK